MAKTQKVLSHVIRHADWAHVNVAYVQTAEIDGESFTKPSEVNLDSPAVMRAAKALEDACLKEIGGILGPTALHNPKRVEAESKKSK